MQHTSFSTFPSFFFIHKHHAHMHSTATREGEVGRRVTVDAQPACKSPALSRCRPTPVCTPQSVSKRFCRPGVKFSPCVLDISASSVPNSTPPLPSSSSPLPRLYLLWIQQRKRVHQFMLGFLFGEGWIIAPISTLQRNSDSPQACCTH